MQRFLLACPVAALLFAGAALADPAPPPPQSSQAQPAPSEQTPSQPPQLSRADQAFAVFAAQNSMGEAQAGQLAMQRGASGRVKQFGQQLMTDQNGINDALQQIVQQDNLAPPPQPSPMQEAQDRRLNVLYGQDFDKAFVGAQVTHTAQAIAMYQREAQSGQDPALKQFAQETLPVLRHHYALAEMLNQEATANEAPWRGQD
ncbi:MAG TPA: DUF4142 domain-containing protein [Acetobacteraceae bacterium]|jgi:putative membrane protein|nr:DUF4142 domain-containing protein [Acetobacteraceae bacterium]